MGRQSALKPSDFWVEDGEGDGDTAISTHGIVYLWRPSKPGSAAAWHFLTIDKQAAAEIRCAAPGRIGGFGSVKVKATIGETCWHTSLFPNKETGGFLLPLKAAVRKAEGLVADMGVDVLLEV